MNTTKVVQFIRSMYVKKDGTLYVQISPDVPIGHKLTIFSKKYTIKGRVSETTKSGLILSKWKIIN